MTIDDLRFLQADFEGIRQDNLTEYRRQEWKREDFIHHFPYEHIQSLTLDEYVIGSPEKKKESFCYWVEVRLNDLGRMKGATALKFGIYFGRTKSDPENKYRTTVGKFGTDPQNAFAEIKTELLDLLEAGKTKNIDRIKNNKLSPMFKGKILFLYYPTDYINIFSEDHLNHFLLKLNIVLQEHDSEIDKRIRLMEFKNKDEVMKSWSTFEYAHFLYTTFKYPPKNGLPEILKPYAGEAYIPLSSVNPTFITLTLGNVEVQEKQNGISGVYKPDYELIHRRSRMIGTRGEEIVLKAEQDYLQKNNRTDLSKKVHHVSLENDGLGYDILSYTLEGDEKYVEVKSSNRSVSNPSFVITRNEYETAKAKKNYYIYYVFDTMSVTPKIWSIKEIFELPSEKINIIPDRYRINFSIVNEK